MAIRHLEDAANLDLKPGTKLVFMALCDDATKETRVTYPGMDKLVTWSGMSPAAVQKVLQQLIGMELLLRRKRGAPGQRAEFRVFPTPEEIDEQARLDAERKAVREARRAAQQPVDNSEIKGGPQATLSNRMGIQNDVMGVLGATPPVKTSQKKLNQSHTQLELEPPVDNSLRSDDEMFSPPKLGIRAQVRRAKAKKLLDVDQLHDMVGDYFTEHPKMFIRQIELQVAYQILGRAVKAGTELHDPTRYVAAAIALEPAVWNKFAHQRDLRP